MPSPIVSVLTPVRSVNIEGLNAMAPQAEVGLTPFVSWSPLSTGTPESYRIRLYALGATGGRTTSQLVFTLLAEDPSVRVPQDMLAAGTSYVFVVDALSGMEEPAAPFRLAIPNASAGFVSEVFTP